MRTFSQTVITLVFCSLIAEIRAQVTDPVDSLDLLSMSFEELMNVRIVSASKNDESLFEAPVTSFVITRADIVNSGATSIPEALRLAPALIVREMANGSYDISIRGGRDNLASHQWWSLNTSILAMIDNRVIFNHYYGGTYWQSLPVDLADVDRIEIVYGPNSPLYGPNALDGVINIITRKSAGGRDSYGSATVQAGQDILFTAMGGRRLSEKLEVSLSLNHSDRKRMEVEYYDPAIQSFVTDLKQHSDTILGANPRLVYPNPETGSRRTGMNFNVFFTPSKNTTLSLNSAYNESIGLIGSTSGAIFQQNSNISLSNMLKAEVGGFTLQSSLIRGRTGNYGNMSEYNYDYQTWDTYLDYDLKISREFSLRPSVSFLNAIINDEPYSVDMGLEGLFNNKASMYNYAFSLKADYKPIQSVRIVGAVRADKFRAPDDLYVSYQGIVNYRTHKKGILRLLAGRSFAGSFIESTYMNWTPYEDPYFKFSILGNPERSLLQNDILEAGYKLQFGKNVSFDFSLFTQRYSNFAPAVTKVVKEMSFIPLEQGEWNVVFTNIGLESEQSGATLAATMLVGKVKFIPSVTVQKTRLRNYSPYYFEPHPVFAPENNIENVSDKDSNYAPDVFGGFSMNLPVAKWNFNISGYYYSQHKRDGLNSIGVNGDVIEPAIGNIQGKLLLNANVGYNISSDFKAFLNVRNFTGQKARESYGTDQIGTLVFVGVNLEL